MIEEHAISIMVGRHGVGKQKTVHIFLKRAKQPRPIAIGTFSDKDVA
jgi:hypothetical protein